MAAAPARHRSVPEDVDMEVTSSDRPTKMPKISPQPVQGPAPLPHIGGPADPVGTNAATSPQEGGVQEVGHRQGAKQK
eukprot:3610394-Lingulodinium_polyedra.AAC.1